MSMLTAPEVTEVPSAASTPPGGRAPRNRDEDSSAGKALALLDAFSGRLAVLGVTTLAERADIPKSTAHRLLNVLVTRGYVRRVGDRYCLTEHMFELGNESRASGPSGVRDLATPYLGELFAQTRQTVQLGVLSGTDVLYLDKVAGCDAAPSLTSVGSRRPVYATGLGKALVAYAEEEAVEENLAAPMRRFTPYTMASAGQFTRSLERVRQEGVATDHEEWRQGVNCVAAPILDSRTGRAIAAISVCSSGSTVVRRYRQALLRIAGELSSQYSRLTAA